MAEQNPIKYSDLISPDDSIERLIAQLENLQSTYEGMASSIQQRAAAVAASLRTVSGATSQGQQTTKKASEDADKLAKAYRDLAFAESENAKKLAELKLAQKEANDLNKLTIKLNQSAEGSYNALSAQYSINKIYLNNMTKEERENTEAGRKLEKETKAIYDEMNRLQQATGKMSLNVGNYTNSINSAIGVNTKWYQGLQQLNVLFAEGLTNGLKTAGAAVGTFGKQLLALLANPIVATIAAIAAAFMALSKGISSSAENTNTLARIMAPFERVLTVVTSVLQTAAGFVLKCVEGFDKLAMGASRLMEKLPLVGGAFKKVNDELQRNIDLTREKQELAKAERESTEHTAMLERNVAKYRAEAAKTDDPTRRAQLMKMAIKTEQAVLMERWQLAKKDLQIKERESKQRQLNKEELDALAAARAKLYNVEKDYYMHTIRLNRQLKKAEKDMNKPAGGGGGKVDTSSEDLAKKRLEEQRKIEDARIALVDDANLRERMTIIASYNRKIEDLEGNAEYIEQMTLLLEQQKQSKLADLLEKEAKQQEDAEKKKKDAQVKAIQDAEKAREAAVKMAEKQINDAYDLEVSIADLEASENKKTQMRLEAEKKRLAALLALYEKDGKTLTETELQILRNGMALVDQEIAKNKKGRDVYDMLGLSLDDDQKQAISDSFSFALDQLSSYLDAWVQAAEQKAQLAAKDVENAQNVLDAEREARAQGYASNVAQAQKELDLAKKTQQKALAEQEKAQRAQEMLATVQQATNLISATALIWSQLGFPWAIPATAIMWGAFAAAKIKAMQVTRSGSEQYGEGTVELLQGGSHQSGNDIDLGRKKDGTRRRAEGGEFFAVINKRNSRKFRDIIPSVIGALNDGTFAQKYMKAYDGGGMSVMVDSQSQDLRGLSNDVKTIREQGETRTYADAQGTHIIHKNLHRIILN